MVFDLEMIKKVYSEKAKKIEALRNHFQRPLTLTEKVLYSHLHTLPEEMIARGKTYLDFSPDRVAMQDATAQMALLQFIKAKRSTAAIPSTVHCDHLILAQSGAKEDLKAAKIEGKEVYDFLEKVSVKYGMGFWPPGAGIIHQVVLENYAFPGGMMLGTDSHTPNAGGLAMIAIGVGGADAVDAMVNIPWELKAPKVIGVKLTGKMSGWTSAKDIILKLAGILTVKGGTDSIVEYFGEGTQSVSCTGKSSACNMGAEIGATCSIFPYDVHMKDYLESTERKEVAALADQFQDFLKADKEVELNPEKFYDQVVEINLSNLEPYVNGPYTPDKAWPISQFAKGVKENQYPEKVSVCLIGSCTNSSYEDIERVCSIAKQAKEKGLQIKCPLNITPGSEQVRATMEKEGHLELLESIGATVLANACGPCIGQWKRHDVKSGEKNSIITSFNRNFSGRNDANPGTHSFVSSPETVMAMSLSGSLLFNPLTDSLTAADGSKFKLNPPTGKTLPPNGFTKGESGFIAPQAQGSLAEITVEEGSERLQLLPSFPAWDGKDITDMLVLLKAEGKCTTDHISPAGKWLKFRGHLDKISSNMFIGAVNQFRDEVGHGLNQLNQKVESFSDVARAYKTANKAWIAIGDENYGEGSSREHAAMEPRFLGCRVVLVKSFARIHETNLKKQGILAITFKNPSDYEKIKEDDLISIEGLNNFSPSKILRVIVKHSDDSKESFEVLHSFNQNQIDWFKAGCALNKIKQSV
ncbi:Aconitate hydratase, mitochondrial [Chlamydiales bacterium SCGC AB-751-O23]|nr:Aconitate hydratase, mitochondrial [Chlamydiales bacterium SCGC AB-751-O23]